VDARRLVESGTPEKPSRPLVIRWTYDLRTLTALVQTLRLCCCVDEFIQHWGRKGEATRRNHTLSQGTSTWTNRRREHGYLTSEQVRIGKFTCIPRFLSLRGTPRSIRTYTRQIELGVTLHLHTHLHLHLPQRHCSGFGVAHPSSTSSPRCQTYTSIFVVSLAITHVGDTWDLIEMTPPLHLSGASRLVQFQGHRTRGVALRPPFRRSARCCIVIRKGKTNTGCRI